MMLLSGCATATFNAVPPLESYSPAVMKHAADELEMLGPACDRLTISPGCSAVTRMIIDYVDLRSRIKALGEES